MFTQCITCTNMSIITGNHVEKNRRCCDSMRCCTIATMDYGTDPISSFEESITHSVHRATSMHWIAPQSHCSVIIPWRTLHAYGSLVSLVVPPVLHQSWSIPCESSQNCLSNGSSLIIIACVLHLQLIGHSWILPGKLWKLMAQHLKGLAMIFHWSGKPINHFQKQGNINIFQNK